MLVLGAPLVKWASVGKILIAGLVGGVGVVVVFGFLILGVSRARRAGNEGEKLVDYAVSAVCGLLCLAAVVIGIYAMVNKPATPKSSSKSKSAAVRTARPRQVRLVA